MNKTKRTTECINIKALLALLGEILLFTCPLIKLNSIEKSYTQYIEDCLVFNDYLLFFVSICLFVVPLFYLLYPLLFMKSSEKLINYLNNKNKIISFIVKKASIIYIIIPIIFFVFCSLDREGEINLHMIEIMGSGFYLYMLCMIIMVILILKPQNSSFKNNENQNPKDETDTDNN